MNTPLPFVLLLTLAGSLCAAPVNLLANGDFAANLDEWNLHQDGAVQAKVVPGTPGGPAHVLRLTIHPEPNATPWSINLAQPIESAVGLNDQLELRLWVRSPDGAQLSPYLELNQDPYPKSLSQKLSPTAEWKEYVVTGKSLAAYQAGQLNFGFHLAHRAGTIELGDVRLYDLSDTAPAGPTGTADHPVPVIENGDFAQGLAGWAGVGKTLTAEPFTATIGGVTKRAMRLTSTPPEAAAPWAVGFGRPISAPVRRGDAVYLRAWLRSPAPAEVSFIFELSGPPNSKDLSMGATLTPEWKEYRFLVRVQRSYKPGEATVKWFLGHVKGVVELADVRVEDYGRAPGKAFDQTIDYWGGRPHDDAWRAEALTRIEQLRKGDVTVTVVDAAGRPVPGAQVMVEQQRHFFRFGTAAPAARFLDTSPDSLRFQQEVVRLFNTVTFENDLKWGGYSESNLARAEQAADWLHQHGVDVRGHCLVWGSWKYLPPAVRSLRGDELTRAIDEHVAQYATRFRGQTYLWDVVNEAGSNTEVWDNVGWDKFAGVFKAARAADPNVRLSYNDYSMTVPDDSYRNKVTARVKQLIAGGAPFDVIGLQEHHGLPLVPLPTILKYLDYWSQFGKDLEITEYDLGCTNDQVHGEWSRDHLIAAFSHPHVVSYIMWGFWEGAHWRAKDGGAMFRRDWTPRPAELAYEDLVLKQWWTRWNGAAGADGTAKLRAFYGVHQVTVTANGKTTTATLDLRPGGNGAVKVTL